MEMTPKERILGAIRGTQIDRVPWSPFLAYYWENLPREIQNKGQLAYMKELSADPLLRGFLQLFGTERRNCHFSQKVQGNKRYDTYETKVGTLTEEYSYSASANTWFLTSHPVKTEEDFKILQYMVENTVITDLRREFEQENAFLGENGVHLPVIGLYGKTAFQSLVERWCGTVDLVYALYDFPEVVEECLDTMREKDRQIVQLSIDSSAEGFIFWEDSSTTNISPDLFEKYTAPEVDQWGEMIHRNGKLLVHHACGHLKDLLPLMGRSQIDAIESISPPPTGNIDIMDAVELLPEHIAIIGGIEPTFFRNCTLEELETRVETLITGMSGKRFVLANSDSCPPDVSHEKFLRVSELVKKR